MYFTSVILRIKSAKLENKVLIVHVHFVKVKQFKYKDLNIKEFEIPRLKLKHY